MEVEFTLPANTAASTAANYTIESWENITGGGYGSGHHSNQKTLNVTAVQLSSDGTRAILIITGLEKGRVVRVIVDEKIKSQSGLNFWYNYADYTLNNFGPAAPVGIKSLYYKHPAIDYSLQSLAKGYRLNLNTPGTYHIKILDLKGKQILQIADVNEGSLALPNSLMAGIYFLKIESAIHSVTEKFSVF